MTFFLEGVVSLTCGDMAAPQPREENIGVLSDEFREVTIQAIEP